MSQLLSYQTVYFIVTLITILTAIGFAVYVIIRSRTPEILREELVAWREKAERLERDNHNLIKSDHLKDVEIAELKAKTNIEKVMETQELIIQSQQQMMQCFTNLFSMVEKINHSQVDIAKVLGRMLSRLDKDQIAM